MTAKTVARIVASVNVAVCFVLLCVIVIVAWPWALMVLGGIAWMFLSLWAINQA